MLNDEIKILWVVAAAVIDGGGCVLVQRRPAGKALAGLWEFPGGKIEQNETPEMALVRELAEELGIDVAVTDAKPVTFASEALSNGHLVLLLYEVRKWRGTPVALHADAVRWCDPSALRRLSMPPADAPLVAALIERMDALD